MLLGVSLAVAAVPEGLPAILSVVLALGVQRMATHRAIVKKLSSVETLGSASVIASDKTGTLTKSEMTVQRVMTVSGQARVTGVGYAPEGSVVTEHGAELTDGPQLVENIAVLSGGSLASNADLQQRDGDWQIEGDPTEAAFLVAERKLGVTERRARRFARVAEIPFTSERKRMSTIEKDHEQGDSLVLITKGAPDVLLERCTRVRMGTEVVELTDEIQQQILADVAELSADALRTLAVAYRPLVEGETADPSDGLEQDLIFVGTVGIIDPPRPEAAVAIGDAHRAGIRVMMIAGDHPQTAVRIAEDLGIVQPGAVALTGLDGATRQVSLHDPDARPIRKGRLGKPVEFGHKAQLVDNDDGIVLDHDVQPGNPADGPRLKPAVERLIGRTRAKPRTVTADRGYGEAGVEDDLHDLGVQNVVIPRKGRPSKARQAHERHRAFRRHLKWRTGCEGRISTLKRSYGWDRTMIDTTEGARIWTGHGVLTHNLIKISALAG